MLPFLKSMVVSFWVNKNPHKPREPCEPGKWMLNPRTPSPWNYQSKHRCLWIFHVTPAKWQYIFIYIYIIYICHIEYTYFIDYIIFGYIFVYISCIHWLHFVSRWSKVKDDCCVFLTACYQSTSFHIFYRFVWPMYDDWIQCFRNPLQRQSSPAEFVHLIHYRCEGFSNKPKLGFVWSDVLRIVP